MGGSGGGSSGKVAFPEYLETIHAAMIGTYTDLDTTMVEVLNEAFTTNPYDDVNLVVYSGRARIDNNGAKVIPTMADSLAAVLNKVNNYDPLTTYKSTITSVASSVDSALKIDDRIAKATTAFSNLIEPEFAAERAKYDAQMAMIGAVLTSAFVDGKTQLNARKLEKVSSYDYDLRAKAQLHRNEIVATHTMNVTQQAFALIPLTKESYALCIEGVKLAIMNEREYTEHYKDLNFEKASWKLDAMDRGFRSLGALQGLSAFVPKTPSMGKTSSMISGAMSGASMGMAAGPWGAAAGGIIGGIAGLF